MNNWNYSTWQAKFFIQSLKHFYSQISSFAPFSLSRYPGVHWIYYHCPFLASEHSHCQEFSSSSSFLAFPTHPSNIPSFVQLLFLLEGIVHSSSSGFPLHTEPSSFINYKENSGDVWRTFCCRKRMVKMSRSRLMPNSVDFGDSLGSNLTCIT